MSKITDGYGGKSNKKAGSKAVQGQMKKTQKEVMSLRISAEEKNNLDQLSSKIKDLGYGYSASNTLRVALRLLNDVDDVNLIRACEALKNEDMRRK